MGETLHTRARVDIRPWPHEPSIAHLILLDVNMVPRHDDISRWIDDLYRSSPEIVTVRTGALFPAAADAFAEHGFAVADRLVLLERTLPPTDIVAAPTAPSSRVRTRRLRQRDLDVAAAIDAGAFPVSWQNDAQSLADIIKATPQARSRVATIDGTPTGIAITGKAGATGYLQRFAVEPSSRRLGIARYLVDDAVRWLSRRGATSALVNTGIDNAAAIALYQGCGFHPRRDQLVVMEHSR